MLEVSVIWQLKFIDCSIDSAAIKEMNFFLHTVMCLDSVVLPSA